MKIFRVLVALISVVLLIALFWTRLSDRAVGVGPVGANTDPTAQVDPLFAELTNLEPRSERVQVQANQDGSVPEVQPQCQGSAVSGFWAYCQDYQALDSKARALKFIEPSTVLLKLDPKERERLGIGTTDGIKTGALNGEKSNAAFTMQRKASFSLFDRWTKCAEAQSEDLCGAILQFYNESSVPSLEQSDPTLVALACQGLNYYVRDPVSVRRMTTPLLTSLRGIQGKEVDWDVVFPVVSVLCVGSWVDPSLREDLLGMIDEPWLEGHRKATYLFLIAGNGTFEEWQEPIDKIVRSPSSKPDTKWGAVEVIRILTAPRKGNKEQRVLPEIVSQAIPDALMRDSYTPLRWAVMELLSEYGGDPGQGRMLLMLEDATAPDRAGVLNFLALKGKADANLCERFVKDKDPQLRQGAIQALGVLARTDDISYGRLRDLAIQDLDPATRRDAIKSLGSSKRPGVLEDLKLAARDTDATVQTEAVQQIGLMDGDQAETLSTLALDATRAPEARGLAFQEWLKDAPDSAVPNICEQMYQDGNPEIQADGYLWKAALALGTNDDKAIAEWEKLSVPSSVLSRGGAVSEGMANSVVGEALAGTFDGTIRDRIKQEIASQMDLLRSPHVTERISQHHSLLSSSPGLASDTGMAKLFEVQERMLRYLQSQSSK